MDDICHPMLIFLCFSSSKISIIFAVGLNSSHNEDEYLNRSKKIIKRRSSKKKRKISCAPIKLEGRLRVCSYMSQS